MNKKTIACIVASLTTALMLPPTWIAIGAAEGIVDGALGRMTIRMVGPWTDADRVWADRLQNDRNIHLESFAGCIHIYPYARSGRAAGYNAVSRRLIGWRVGDDYLERTNADVRSMGRAMLRARSLEILVRKHPELAAAFEAADAQENDLDSPEE